MAQRKQQERQGQRKREAGTAKALSPGEKLLLDINDVACLLSVGITSARMLSRLHPDFPKPVDLFCRDEPDRGKRLYLASEIRRWAEALGRQG